MLEVEPGRVKMIAPSAIEVWSSLPSRVYSLTAFRLGADTVSWLPSRIMLHDVAVGAVIPVVMSGWKRVSMSVSRLR